MTGAEIILNTAADAGVEICFANPGTTELPPRYHLWFRNGI